MRELNAAGVALIKSFEGLDDGDPTTVNLDPYMDMVGVWTIGWGHAIRDGAILLRGEVNRARASALYPGGITPGQAETLLRADSLDACAAVTRLVSVSVTDNQFAALVSFAFNLGPDALLQSTLLDLLNLGDYDGAACEFEKWNHAGGKIVAGLTRRRLAERDLFLSVEAA